MRHSFGRPPDGVGVRKKRVSQGNEAIIRGAMKDRGIRGNPRDYVLLLGDRLLDCSGSFAMFQVKDGEPEPKKIEFGNEVLLIHKRDLHRYASEPVAAKFWNKKLGVRIPQHRPKQTRR